MKTILFVCGEPSGADYVNDILVDLRQRHPEARLFAVGDSANPVEGVEYLLDYRRFTYFGMVAVFLHFIPIYIAAKSIVSWCKKNHPDLVVLVDSPGLNLNLAKAIRPWCHYIYYFISPHFWAWHYNRIHNLHHRIDRMFPVLPFEVDMYRKEGIAATLVQHPKIARLQRIAQDSDKAPPAINFDSDCDVVGLLPGSRPAEIARFLPILTQTALTMLENRSRLRFVMPVRAGSLSARQKASLNKKLGNTLVIVEGNFYQAVKKCDFCLCASGTASLEIALMRVPMVVYYKLGVLDSLCYRLLSTTKFVSLVNLLFNRRVVAECLGNSANPDVLSTEMEILFRRRGIYQNQLDRFDHLNSMLTGETTIVDEVAEFIASPDDAEGDITHIVDDTKGDITRKSEAKTERL